MAEAPARRRGPPPPRPGEVIRYAYLWTHEAGAGAEEGRKDRPCAVVLALARAEGAVEVVVAPITSSRPARAADSVELPAETRRRLGLQEAPCWVVLTEVNRFAWPGPDLRPVETAAGPSWSHGLLPARLFARVRDEIVAGEGARAPRRAAVGIAQRHAGALASSTVDESLETDRSRLGILRDGALTFSTPMLRGHAAKRNGSRSPS